MASYTEQMRAKTKRANAVAKPTQKKPLHNAPLNIQTQRSQALLQRATEEPLALTRADLQRLQATAGTRPSNVCSISRLCARLAVPLSQSPPSIPSSNGKAKARQRVG
jgi:site-specific recombinase XerC